METDKQPNQILEFHARVWSSGDRLLIPVPKDLKKIYDLDGKFVKVTMEVLGSWK